MLLLCLCKQHGNSLGVSSIAKHVHTLCVATAFPPKLHLYVHQKTCATIFKQNYSSRVVQRTITVMHRIMEKYTTVRTSEFSLHTTKWMNLTTKCWVKEFKLKKVEKEFIVIYCDRSHNVVYYLCGIWYICGELGRSLVDSCNCLKQGLCGMQIMFYNLIWWKLQYLCTFGIYIFIIKYTHIHIHIGIERHRYMKTYYYTHIRIHTYICVPMYACPYTCVCEFIYTL